jgi:hypothetical protein
VSCAPDGPLQSGRFFKSPSSIGVHFHRGRVQTESFDLDAQNLLLLQSVV